MKLAALTVWCVGLTATVGCGRGSSLDAQYGNQPAIEVLTGKASYYHDSLAGNLTANGETYRRRRHTAAHLTLPFCTIVRVVRADTGASVIVRINDRGPFGNRGRILDLSRGAAEEIDMIERGVVPIRAEILERGNGCTSHPRRR